MTNVDNFETTNVKRGKDYGFLIRKDEDYDEAFYYATEIGNMDMLLWLDAHCPERKKQLCYEKALESAVKNGRDEVVEWLIEKGVKDADGYALWQCLRKGWDDWVVWLVDEHGFDSMADGGTLIESAAMIGNLSMTKFLIERSGLPPQSFLRAFKDAACNGHVDIVRWFVSQGIGEKALEEVVPVAARGGSLNVLMWLDSQGVDMTAHIQKSIIKAERHRHFDVVDWLEEYQYTDKLMIEHRKEPLDPFNDHCIVWKRPLKQGEKFRMCDKRHIVLNEQYLLKNKPKCEYCDNLVHRCVYTNTGPEPPPEEED